MRDQAEPAKPWDAINLATVPDFALGSLLVQPSRRRVGAGASGETVEPRVMQSLIALAEAGGAVVSRDVLIDRCWGGRIVGEDAINRCIAKVRRLAETTQPPAFAIETVAKVGYRLQILSGAANASAPAAPAEPNAARLILSPLQTRWQSLARPGSRFVGTQPGSGAVQRWRRTGLATIALVVAMAAVAWRMASPINRPPATARIDSFNPPPHSVAVLAFANLSNDPGQDYLSDGLSEALIDALSRADQLRVTARTSSFYFKGRPATVSDIARKLNVGAVLEGSLRRQGTRLRIDAHLSDARTGYQLWVQSYDLELADMLNLQDQIAGAVAEALRTRLLGSQTAGRSPGGTTNPQAFDAYLRAEHDVFEGKPGRSEAILAEFRKAAALDPDFALALVGISGVLTFQMGYEMSTADPAHRKAMQEARHDAERAIALAPGLGLPHAQLGMVLLTGLNDFNTAWAEAVRAKALTPGDVSVEEAYAAIAMAVGRPNQGIEAAARAVELDPLREEAWFTTMRTMIFARRYDEALTALQRAIALRGDPPIFAPYKKGEILLKQGKPEAARQICLTTTDWTDQCLAIAYHALGRQKDAQASAAQMWARAGDDNSYNLATVYAQWGQPALAMHWLKRAREINDPGLAQLEGDAWLDPIRGQPGFREIEQSLHLPPAD